MATKKVKRETESVAPKMAAPAQPEQPAAGTQTATDLNIADLRNIALVIDVASTRGAFRANEMATVGLIYNKLQAFLAKVAPETKPEENKTAEAPAAAGK